MKRKKVPYRRGIRGAALLVGLQSGQQLFLGSGFPVFRSRERQPQGSGSGCQQGYGYEDGLQSLSMQYVVDAHLCCPD